MLQKDCRLTVLNYSPRVLPANKENALTVCDYISLLLKSEINPSDSYRKNNILLLCILLCTFSIFFKNAKLFKEVTREDILSSGVFAKLKLLIDRINGLVHTTNTGYKSCAS